MSAVSQAIHLIIDTLTQNRQDQAQQVQIQQATARNNGIHQAPPSLLTRISNVAFPIIQAAFKVTLGLALLAANIALPIIPILMAHVAITGLLAYAIVSLLVIGADLVAFRYCINNASINNAVTRFGNAVTRLFEEGVI